MDRALELKRNNGSPVELTTETRDDGEEVEVITGYAARCSVPGLVAQGTSRFRTNWTTSLQIQTRATHRMIKPNDRFAAVGDSTRGHATGGERNSVRAFRFLSPDTFD